MTARPRTPLPGRARAGAASVLLALVLVVAGCAASSPAVARPGSAAGPGSTAIASTPVGGAASTSVAGAAAAASTGPTGASPAVDRASGLPLVPVADLPPEAWATIALIRRDGPFPYPQDGSVFANREGLLPARASGWYREYTVETPASADRGARRIVAGRDGTLYWTDDHYASFAVVAP